MFVTVRWLANAVKLHTIVWKSCANVVAPVFELLSCPFKLVIVMTECSGRHLEENVEFAVGRCDDRDFGFDGSENVERNFLENIWEDVFNAEICKLSLMLAS